MTVREWLTANHASFSTEENMISACQAACHCERNQVLRILKSMKDGLLGALIKDVEVTPHWKYDSMYDRFRDWMGIEAEPKPARRKAKAKKVVHGVLACLHTPFHDEEVLREAVSWFEAENVDVVHIAGDLADLHSMSHFTKFEEVPIQREAVAARMVVEYLVSKFQEVKVLEGNHEARERKYLARAVPPDLLAWFLEKSFLARVLEGLPNVELVKMTLSDVPNYELGWIEVVGDAVIGHAEKTTSMVDSLRGVEKLRAWLNDGWGDVLDIHDIKVVFNAHSHRGGIIPLGNTIILCELGCCCKLSGYALSPTKLYRKPQTQAATIFAQVDGVTEINSVRQRLLGR